MGFRNLGMAFVFVAVLAVTFGAAFAFLQTRPKVEPEALAPLPETPETVVPPPTIKEEPTTKAPEDRKPAPKSASKKPLTCAEATKLGDDCVGRRVTWVGKWSSSQSATIGKKKGTQHFFHTQGPRGDFSFDYPFVAEDPNPLELAKRPQDIKPLREKHWGSTGVVTVTGTIARVETLIMIGQGTRYNVPVLTDITITINP